MGRWKQPVRAMDNLGQSFSDPPLMNLPAFLSTNTCRHLCHWICPWQARWFLGWQFFLLSQTWTLPFFSCGSGHSRFPFWLAELLAMTAWASCLLPIHSSTGRIRAAHCQPERLIIISLGDVGRQGILISRDTFTSKVTKVLSIPLNGHQKDELQLLGLFLSLSCLK